ncbi:hypothetical protein BJY24_007649 [Nocardia transvalensis]|uniref:DUF1707 domain-containing protein n=1 Tax=Nocardia transvalensis TaxID=37333 RepID=A0A7W9UMU4_9NOCA|nr:DUF1707 domain-containing protein [Nocardia transvalensis]MBB5918737.1 hypothetical protein [Nocardia transvalensis]
MTELPESRLSEADRERALRELSQHLSNGRLSLAEFDELSVAATKATTKAELARVFVDLPAAAQPPDRPEYRPLTRAELISAAIAVFALVCAIATGTWWWLLLLLAIPVVFLRLR